MEKITSFIGWASFISLTLGVLFQVASTVFGYEPHIIKTMRSGFDGFVVPEAKVLWKIGFGSFVIWIFLNILF